MKICLFLLFYRIWIPDIQYSAYAGHHSFHFQQNEVPTALIDYCQKGKAVCILQSKQKHRQAAAAHLQDEADKVYPAEEFQKGMGFYR